MVSDKTIIKVAIATPIIGFAVICCICGGLALTMPAPRVAPQSAEPATTPPAVPVVATPTPPREREPGTIDAWVMAEKFVTAELRSPSTASFGGLLSGNRQDPDEHVARLGNGQYRVSGWVDSQNAFGATVRTNFTLTLQHLGGQQWQCTEGPLFFER